MSAAVKGRKPVTVDRTRTAAATAARGQQKARRLAQEMGPRVMLLPDEILIAFAGVVLAEIDYRGLPVPEPDC